MLTLVDYLREDVSPEEQFVPPTRNTPARKKWLDSRKARHASYWLYGSDIMRKGNGGFTHNGIPYWQTFRGNIYYNVHGIQRPDWLRKIKHMNGVVEWLGTNGDAWSRPHIHRKSSRSHMRMVPQWWEQAYEELSNPIE